MSKTQDCLLVTRHGGATNLSKSKVKNWTSQITAVFNPAEFPRFATFKDIAKSIYDVKLIYVLVSGNIIEKY